MDIDLEDRAHGLAFRTGFGFLCPAVWGMGWGSRWLGFGDNGSYDLEVHGKAIWIEALDLRAEAIGVAAEKELLGDGSWIWLLSNL